MSIGEKLRHGYRAYDRFMEKQGFYVMLGVCVLVIVFSALYTFRMRQELENPVLTDAQQQAVESVDSSQGSQTLREAQMMIASKSAEPTFQPVPTVSGFAFGQPVEGFVGRSFSIAEPQYFAQNSVWQIHPGLDLEAEYGAIVSACAAGKVLSLEKDPLLGLTLVIQHQDGYESLYAGLSDAPYVRAGDPVSAGQTIGHAGNGVLAEADAPAHLHLEVRKGGQLIDPLPLFLGVEK